jgi:hypothetical protein
MGDLAEFELVGHFVGYNRDLEPLVKIEGGQTIVVDIPFPVGRTVTCRVPVGVLFSPGKRPRVTSIVRPDPIDILAKEPKDRESYGSRNWCHSNAAQGC